MSAGSFQDLVDTIAAAGAGLMKTLGRGGVGQLCGHGGALLIGPGWLT